MNWYKENWDKVNYVLLLGFVITLPFSIGPKLNNFFIILIFAHSLFNIKFFSSRTKLLYSSLILIYVAQLVGIVYSSNLDQGLFDLEKKISFVIFPILFGGLRKIEEEKYYHILLAFAIVTFGVSLVCVGDAIVNYIKTADQESFYYYRLSEIVDMHPIYLSMYSCLSIFILIKIWDKLKPISLTWTIVMILCGVYLFIFIMMLSARAEILAFLLIIIVGFIWYGIKNGKVIRVLGALVILLITTSLLIMLIPTLNERFKEAVNYNSEYTIDKQWGGRALRLLKWDCSLDIISKNLIFGVGTGDTQDMLQECYVRKNYGQLLFYPDVKYNAHNQYFQTTISNGIIGLLALLSSLVVAFYMAINTRNYLFLAFILLFSMACMTESMLEVNKGIVFFSFFWSFFINNSTNSFSVTSKL